MFGVALASAIHMCLRWVITLVLFKLDEDLEKSDIPLTHPDSFKDLGKMAIIGWETFLVKVMGWWAFDVFT